MWLGLLSIVLIGQAASSQGGQPARMAPATTLTTVSASCGRHIVTLKYQNGYRGNASRFLSLSVNGKAIPAASALVQSIARAREIETAEVMYCGSNRTGADADIVINFARGASGAMQLPSVSVLHLRGEKLIPDLKR